MFEPVEMGHIQLKNRLVRSATWEGIANPDGSIMENTYSIYDELAAGGVGAVITGFTSVALHDTYFGGMMRLCDDALVPQYKHLTDIVHAHGTPVISQLALGAYYRQRANRYTQVEPDDMTVQEIQQVTEQFCNAAVRAEQAGFDGVQIHAAHFFFLSRFISPAVNHRQDAYGACAENRSRILLEIYTGIRKAAPSLHISMKINSSDFTFGGLDEAGCIDICKRLDAVGIDSIEISGNGTSVSGIRAHHNEGYFVPTAAKVAQAVHCPVIVVGGFRSLDTMESVLNSTPIQLISLSRPLLREPDLPKKLQQDAGHVSACVSCNACYSSPSHRCIWRERELGGRQ